LGGAVFETLAYYPAFTWVCWGPARDVLNVSFHRIPADAS
jgi:hypothetical protein